MEKKRKSQADFNPFAKKKCTPAIGSHSSLGSGAETWRLADFQSAATHRESQPTPHGQADGSSPETCSEYDVGSYVDCRLTLNDDMKYKLLTQPWTPNASYEFPVYKDSEDSPRPFNYLWLKYYPFMSYSGKCAGVFCRTCMLFAPVPGGGKKPSVFISVPYSNWKKATAEFRNHAAKRSHQTACLKAQMFTTCYENKDKSLMPALSNGRCAQVEANRKKLVPIIETVLFAGKKGLPLRGKHDDGELDMNNEGKSEGIFQSLLRSRCQAGDVTLHEHLVKAPKNAKYTSKTIQNEIIQKSAIIIRSKLVNEINESGFFTVLADETTDISNTEQMSVCVRYVREEPLIVCEVFLGFLPVYDLTGASLATTLLDFLTKCGLDLTKLRGQSYGGATSTSGRVNGVQAHIKSDFPAAVYSHSVSHALNLAIAKSCTVCGIENTLSTLNEVINFFEESSKRMKYLSDAIASVCPESGYKCLQSACASGWVERHESIAVFSELYDAVIAALEVMQTDRDKAIRDKADRHSKDICDFEFIINLMIAESLLGITLPLSKELQKVNADIVECYNQVKVAVGMFKDKSSSANKEFTELFRKAQSVATKHDIEVTLSWPRHRCGVPCGSVEDYFRMNNYVPFLDSMTRELTQRFTLHGNAVTELSILIPQFSSQHPSEKLSRVLEMYDEDLLDSWSVVQGEFQMWKKKWEGVGKKELPSTAIESLASCSKKWYPNMHILLKILCTLPVSTATVERSLSSLWRIKTWFRSRMGEERLNALAMLNINSSVEVTVSEVLDALSRRSRRLDFVL
ncbi:52 kDa repressor of the inhibitor of the protein kinase [Alligator mississippiensis]|uniref:52 kDa repressor of the inhibitor of the protein kinase n=1 Tax=Alligator mississippiensis TaxID=8496 RepID=UPI00287730CB|nr:52 kDa repressor of the inhibitor of the protein kinase [Alligator mississippiensis]